MIKVTKYKLLENILTCGGSIGWVGVGWIVGGGMTGESERDHFLLPSQLAVISMPRILTDPWSSWLISFLLAATS